jgi:hypothetical protein
MTFRLARMLWVVLLTSTVVFFFDLGSSAGSSLSFDEYRSRLEQSLQVVRSGESQLKPEETARLKEFFPPGLHVMTREGAEVLLYRNELIASIDKAGKSPEGRKSLARFLEALLRQVFGDRAVIPLADQDWKQSRAMLDGIYRLKEFEGLREQQPPPWLEQLRDLLRRLGEWMGAVFKTIQEKLPGRWMRYVLYGFLLLAAGLLILWIVRNLGPARGRWRSVSLRTVPSAKPVEMDWKHWRNKAVEEASRGAFRDAVRFFFISVLMEGHERGWWTYNPEGTNREHLERVKGPRERNEALKQLINLYEKLWYGQEEAGSESYQSCAEWLRRMEAAS